MTGFELWKKECFEKIDPHALAGLIWSREPCAIQKYWKDKATAGSEAFIAHKKKVLLDEALLIITTLAFGPEMDRNLLGRWMAKNDINRHVTVAEWARFVAETTEQNLEEVGAALE